MVNIEDFIIPDLEVFLENTNSKSDFSTKARNFDDILNANDDVSLNHLGISRKKNIAHKLHYMDINGYKDLINFCKTKDLYESIEFYPFIKLIINDSIYKEIIKSNNKVEKLFSNRDFAFLLSLIGLYHELTDCEFLQIYRQENLDELKGTVKYLNKIIMYRQPLAIQHLDVFGINVEKYNRIDALSISVFMSDELRSYYLYKSFDKEVAERCVKNDIIELINKLEDTILNLQMKPKEYTTLKEFVTITNTNELTWKTVVQGKIKTKTILVNKEYLFTFFIYLTNSKFDVPNNIANKL